LRAYCLSLQKAEDHVRDLKEVFHQVCKYNMRLNREKCVFRVSAGKFLGFMLTAQGIEVNPDKCAAIAEMRSPKNLKEIQRLVGRLTSLARFLPKLTEGRGPRSRPKRGLSPSAQVQHASQP